MYYYGGYNGYSCNQTNAGYTAAIILVLFILLIIVFGVKSFSSN